MSLPPFPSFNVHEDGNAGPRWEKWLKRFERLLVAMNMSNDARKRALLLHYAGPTVDEIFDTLEDTGTDYKTAADKLTEYFSSQVNTTYEVFKFRQTKQNDSESIDSYHTRLRQLAKTCGFTDTDKEIKEHIILTCHSNALRRRALREDYDLPTLLKTGRSLELSESQASTVESNEVSVNAVKYQAQTKKSENTKPRNKGRNNNNYKPSSKNVTPSRQCRNCGGQFPHQSECPAKGKECRSCGKMNHFARVCRSKSDVATGKVRNVEAFDSDSEYVYTVSNAPDFKSPRVEVMVDNTEVSMMIDSGATVNLIDEATFLKVNKRSNLTLGEPRKQIFSYGSTTPLPVLGTVLCTIQTGHQSVKALMYVIKGSAGNLLSFNTARELELISIQVNEINTPGNVPQFVQQDFNCLFGDVKKVKGKIIKLHVDETVTPKQQPHRRIPFHVRKDVERELERLEKLDIIEKVDGPTPWVSPIVVVPKKSGEVRICVDMREANKAIQREKHVMPTIDDLISDLNGATVFSKLDLSSGYHQFELEPESRQITTFSTHVGLRRYKRLMFGINAAPEIFQNAIEELLTGIQACRNISDDIIVYGSSQEEHDRELKKILTRLKEYNVSLNREKCEFSKSEIEFYGHVFSADGIKPDPKKITAILEMDPPQNASEVKSLLGMAQYVSRFIPNYATITSPLRALTRQDAEWKWESEEQKAFENLKTVLTSEDRVMSYFDPKKRTEIVVDASPVGLGALLVQDGRVLSYASRALSDVERRYSQVEREMLAVVWGAEKFHMFVYGSHFTIYTDHKPLLGIFKSSKHTSARIDRWKLRLMPYDYSLVYRPGRDAENPADFLSRHPDKTCKEECNYAEEFVAYVCNNAVPKAMTLEEIKEGYKEDDDMQVLIKVIENNKWHEMCNDNAYAGLKKVKDEISVYNGFVIRGYRIVIPVTLQHKAVDLAHIGHQGIVKTKGLLREKVWFPGIDKMVESKVKHCLTCQAATPGQKPHIEPLNMTPLPQKPWSEVAADFAGPFPSGDYLLVAIDEYSRYPEVEITKSTAATTVIPKLDSIFARQGIPDQLKTDNGTPFQSDEFKRFADHLGFKHRRITPYWPRANGEVERFMETIKKYIRAAVLDGLNWKQELFSFLRQYRATPHSTTGISPSEALNGRRLKIPLPEIKPSLTQLQPTSSDVKRNILRNDTVKKASIKAYADRKLQTQDRNLNVGDAVLMTQKKKNALTTPFNPKPMVVTQKKGSMVIASDGSKTVTRNSSEFKSIQCEDRQVQSDQSTHQVLRRSQRVVKPPTRFADYVKAIQE